MIDWKFIVSRCSTALHKLPAEILTMTLPQVYDLFDHWKVYPPMHESAAIALQVYTTWKPQIIRSEEDAKAAHRKSLEERWRGGYMNVKQMFEASQGGGSLFARRTDPASVPAQAAAP